MFQNSFFIKQHWLLLLFLVAIFQEHTRAVISDDLKKELHKGKFCKFFNKQLRELHHSLVTCWKRDSRELHKVFKSSFLISGWLPLDLCWALRSKIKSVAKIGFFAILENVGWIIRKSLRKIPLFRMKFHWIILNITALSKILVAANLITFLIWFYYTSSH